MRAHINVVKRPMVKHQGYFFSHDILIKELSLLRACICLDQVTCCNYTYQFTLSSDRQPPYVF